MIMILHYNGNLTQGWKTSLHSFIQKAPIQLKAIPILENYNTTKITLNLVIH